MVFNGMLSYLLLALCLTVAEIGKYGHFWGKILFYSF